MWRVPFPPKAGPRVTAICQAQGGQSNWECTAAPEPVERGIMERGISPELLWERQTNTGSLIPCRGGQDPKGVSDPLKRWARHYEGL